MPPYLIAWIKRGPEQIVRIFYPCLIEWIELVTQLLSRVFKPASRPTAFFYLVGAIIAFGGSGLWVTVFFANSEQVKQIDLAVAVVTYALAIVGTSLGDLILERDSTRNLKFLLFFLAVIALGLSGYFTYSAIYVAPTPVRFSALLYAVLPVWATWWLINGVDQRFATDFVPRDAIGGDAGQQL